MESVNFFKSMSQLRDMTERIVQVFHEYDKQGTKTWTYDVAANDLQYQVGSLIKRILQLKGFRYKEGLSDDDIREKLADELADILAEVLFIAHDMDIDIETACDKMLESDERKIQERSS